MSEATLIDGRYPAFAGMLTANIAAVPIGDVEFFTRNENREKLPVALGRLRESVDAVQITPRLVTLTAGQMVADWLVARERLHYLLTGEKVVLRDMFVWNDELLARRDLIPTFRPAGATNGMVVDWKLRLGVEVFEEVDVMSYKNAEGPKTPELYLINRSVRPDEDTLGKNAKSPDELIAVPKKKWCNLYHWSDADSLHFAITGKHLDPETWSWFPEDRLPDDRVADGGSSGGKVWFGWGYRGGRRPNIGARAAIPVPFKT